MLDVATPRSPLLALALTGVLAGAGDRARAQPDPEDADQNIPFAALGCYLEVRDVTMLDSRRAARLCRGATSDGTARCFAAADERLFVSTSRSIELCRGASSTGPVECFERLADRTLLDDRQIVRYCAAGRRWVTAPARPGAPGCLDTALDQTFLSERQALRLCRGAAGTSPVDCYRWGEDETFIDTMTLVELCAPTVTWRWPPARR